MGCEHRHATNIDSRDPAEKGQILSWRIFNIPNNYTDFDDPRLATKNSRELHAFFTLNIPNPRKLSLVMQGAFVVRIGAHQKTSLELEGRIEEVDTGRSFRFHSGEELIDFLRGRQGNKLTELE